MIAVVAAIVGAVVIFVVVLVVHACSADQNLREKAHEAEMASSVSAAQVVAAPVGGVGIESGNVASGGIAVRADDVLYVTSTDGVFFRDAADTADDTARKLVSENAYDLNVSDGSVYYLVAASGGRTPFEGSEIRSVAAVSEGAKGLKSSDLVYKPSKGAFLSCLSVANGSCYFLERVDDAHVAKCLDLESGEVESIAEAKAVSAWLFVERDTLYLVSTTDAAWSAKRTSLDSGKIAFTEVSKGTGQLCVAALEGDKLYFAVASKDGDVHLQCSDLKGGVAEYADVTNPMRVAASGDVVAVVTKDGRLIWIDAVTSVAHDLTDRLNALIPAVVPTSIALSVQDGWVCVADGKDDFCRLSTYDAKTVATV